MEDILFALEAYGADRQLHLWSTYFGHYLLTPASQTLYLLARHYKGIRLGADVTSELIKYYQQRRG